MLADQLKIHSLNLAARDLPFRLDDKMFQLKIIFQFSFIDDNLFIFEEKCPKYKLPMDYLKNYEFLLNLKYKISIKI